MFYESLLTCLLYRNDRNINDKTTCNDNNDKNDNNNRNDNNNNDNNNKLYLYTVRSVIDSTH